MLVLNILKKILVPYMLLLSLKIELGGYNEKIVKIFKRNILIPGLKRKINKYCIIKYFWFYMNFKNTNTLFALD
jgi:hypothetical protein